jgi:hypothetical protein
VGILHITVVQDTTAPTMPTGFTATALSASAIELDWADSTDTQTGVDHYELYRDGALLARVLPTPAGQTLLTQGGLVITTEAGQSLQL